MTNIEKYLDLTSYEKKKAYDNYYYYLKSTDKELNDVYNSYSSAKYDAFIYCKNLKNKLYGRDLRIVRHNRNVFTAGFVFEINDALYFMYITPSFDAAVKIADN